MSDITRRRLTIADIGRKPFLDLTEQPPQAAPRPPVRPAAPKPPSRAAPPPRPVPPPPTPAETAKAQRLTDTLATLTTLGQRFPRAFGASCIPLAIGIHSAILAQTGIDPAMLKPALRRWCSRDRYIAACASGTHRHGLDGAPVTELTDEERARAAERLAAFKRGKP
jgi:hypothetical protein